MTTLERLYVLCETYETFSYDYLLKLAKEKADYIYRMVRSRRGDDEATKYLLTYSALLANCNFRVSETIYNFFVEATGIKALDFNQFLLFGRKIIGDLDVKMMFRETANELGLPKEFDNALFVYALAFSACDGRITDRESGFILEFVPFGDFSNV